MPWYKTQPIAYKGLHDNLNIPENSYLAFEKAMEFNYTIQLDVRLTKDQKLVVCCDENLQRLTGENLDISKNTYSKIKKLLLLNSKEKIPLLKDVLHLIHGKVPVLLELKTCKKDAVFEKLICENIASYKGALAIHSNNHFTIKWFKKHCSHIARGQILVSKTQNPLQSFTYNIKQLYSNWVTKPDFIACKESEKPHFLAQYYKNKNIPFLSNTCANSLFHA